MFPRLSLLLVLVLATAATAQDFIPARAGFVNYQHGDVVLPTGVEGKAARQLEPGQTVATRHGRVEILLVPGSFLRLDNESEVRLLSSQLTDVQVELLSGTATLEINEISHGSALALFWRGQRIPIAHTGLFRFEPGGDSLRIYVESGKLELGGKTLKAGKYADLSPDGAVSEALNFKTENLDEFDRWNQGRGYELARHSSSAASAFIDSPSYYYPGFYSGASLWYWQPFCSCYTYLPYSRRVASPWGYYYASPGHYWHGQPPGRQPGRGTPPVASTPAAPSLPAPSTARGGNSSDAGSAKADNAKNADNFAGKVHRQDPRAHPPRPSTPLPPFNVERDRSAGGPRMDGSRARERSDNPARSQSGQPGGGGARTGAPPAQAPSRAAPSPAPAPSRATPTPPASSGGGERSRGEAKEGKPSNKRID